MKHAKIIRKSFIYVSISSLIIILILELTNYFIVLFLLFDIVLYFIFPSIFIKNIKIKQIIYIAMVSIGLYSLINTSTSFITTLINSKYVTTGISNIIINILFTGLVFYLSTKKKTTDFIVTVLSTSKSVKFVFVFFIWELLILATALTVLLLQTDTKPIISFTCFSIFTIMIASCVVLYLLIINNLKSIYYKNINNNIKTNIDKQVKHYEQLSKANENLRKFRHDYNNLKIGLNFYLQNKDIDGAILYLDECNKITETEYIIYHTGHHIVDALFSDKANTIKKNNIHIIFNGLIPSDILTPVDLCIIFGNTLDNAIEACHKFENDTVKNINVTVKQNYDYVFVTITNPTTTNIEIKNNNILTTKKDNELHGIGLSSIKQILKKYDGHLFLSCEHNMFTTELDFCISSNTQLK